MKVNPKKEISVIISVSLLLTYVVMPVVIILSGREFYKTPLDILNFYVDDVFNSTWTGIIISMTIISVLLRLSYHPFHHFIFYLKKRFSKKKLALFSAVISFILFLIIGEAIWKDEFLPWIRYRDHTSHSQRTNHLFIGSLSDTTFSYSRRFSIYEYRTIVTWQGDTLRTNSSISCGYYYYQPPSEVFSGYDTTLVRFIDSSVEPLRVGESPLFVNYYGNLDTAQVAVSKADGHLFLDISQ